MNVKRTEQGWPGHFCGVSHCLFRRNTLLECGDTRIIVSTVGAMLHPLPSGGRVRYMPMGSDRYYETMVFHAERVGVYWEANVSREVGFDSEWAVGEIEAESDEKANQMHESVVAEITGKLKGGGL